LEIQKIKKEKKKKNKRGLGGGGIKKNKKKKKKKNKSGLGWVWIKPPWLYLLKLRSSLVGHRCHAKMVSPIHTLVKLKFDDNGHWNFVRA